MKNFKFVLQNSIVIEIATEHICEARSFTLYDAFLFYMWESE
jgi:hypothetical protein